MTNPPPSELREALRLSEVRVASLCEVRDQLQALRAEERAERDRLAEQVQRVRDLMAAKTVAHGKATCVRYLLDQADVERALDGEVPS